MPARRARLNARTFALLALLLCGGRAVASAQTAAPTPAQTPEPASIAIVIDTSASVWATFDSDGKRLRQALARFVEAGGGRDEFFIFRVSTETELHLDRTEDASEVVRSLSKLLSRRKVGATALFDGCALAATKAADGKHTRRAVLLLSDGVDTISSMSLGDVEGLLKRAGVRLFAVEVGDRRSGGAYYEGGANNLSKLAKASGGAVYRLNKAGELDSILAAVRAELSR